MTAIERKAERIDVSAGYTAKSIWDANAGNPIMPGYIGDPFMFRDDDGTFYVYGTTDGYGDNAGSIYGDGPYCVWYSKDLVNWKCKTFRYEDGTFPKETKILWAPSVTKAANGKYYMAYIWNAYNCYLASSDSPLGPWMDELDGEVVAADMFDTDIITIDGDTYVVTQGPLTNNKKTIYLGKFKEDMSGLDENGLKPIFNDNVFEAPGIFKRDGKYYLTFANGSLGSGTYRVDYAIAEDIWGPYTGKGTILQRYGDIHTTGHNNCVQIGDDWYICYHRKVVDGNYSYARQAAMEKMSFNEDGTIAVMQPTVNGNRPDIALTKTGKNLAYDGVLMTASSVGTESGLGKFTCLPMYAADRNNGTLWTAADTGAQWLMMDLGEIKNINCVETYFEYHTLAYKYKIEYSSDGKNWRLFSDKMNNESLDSPQVDVGVQPIKARYLKMSFEGGVNVGRDVPVGVFEMNVYEASEKNIINSISTSVGENGVVNFTVDYETVTETSQLYTAVYDENGALVYCNINEKDGGFTPTVKGEYKIKAFLWDDLRPLCETKETTFIVQ
ncbi:MAG: family 43 glycosylhydrolase [Hominilimicola sp.]